VAIVRADCSAGNPPAKFKSLSEKAARAFLLFLVVVLAIDSPAVFDYEDDDENDWQPRLFKQPLQPTSGRRTI
jgi:hypothetical protein